MLDGAKFLSMMAFMLFCLASWVNHIVICIMLEKYALLIAGAIMFPIAMCHGAGNFLGFF